MTRRAVASRSGWPSTAGRLRAGAPEAVGALDPAGPQPALDPVAPRGVALRALLGRVARPLALQPPPLAPPLEPAGLRSAALLHDSSDGDVDSGCADLRAEGARPPRPLGGAVHTSCGARQPVWRREPRRPGMRRGAGAT